ncbi:MAG: T9SS type A sorting domain-containing protein [Bacteroidales bacterium]
MEFSTQTRCSTKWTLKAFAIVLVSLICFDVHSSSPIPKELFNYTSDYNKCLDNWIKVADKEHKNSILITDKSVQLCQRGNKTSSITADTLTINIPLKDAKLSFKCNISNNIPLELEVDGRTIGIDDIDNSDLTSTISIGDVARHLTIKTNSKKDSVHLTNIRLIGDYHEANITSAKLNDISNTYDVSWNKSISTPFGKFARERVELLNENGDVIYSSDINDSSNEFNNYSFNIEELEDGNYSVRIITTDEEDTSIIRSISKAVPLSVFGSVRNFNYKINGQYINASWENLRENLIHRLVIYDLTLFEKVRISELTSGEEIKLPISLLDESYLSYFIGIETLNEEGEFRPSIGRLDLKIINKGDTIVEAGEQITLSPPARTIWRFNSVTIKMRSDEEDGSPIPISGGAIPLSGQIIKTGEGGITFKKATIDMDLYRYRRYHFTFPFVPDMIRIDNSDTEAKVKSDFYVNFYDNLARSEGATSYFRSVTLNSEGENPYDEFIPGEGLQFSIDGEPNTRIRTNFKISAEETINNFDYLTYSLVKSKTSFYNSNATNAILNGWNYIGSPFPKKTIAAGLRQAYVYDGKAYKLYGFGLEYKEIPTFASFFVQTTESDKTISFALDSFLVSDQASTLASLSSLSRNNTPNFIRLRVSDATHEDVMLLKEIAENKQFYTIGNDLTKMFATDASIPQIYSKVSNNSVVIRSIDMNSLEEGVDFWVKCGKSGEHTISLPLNEWSKAYDYKIKDSDGNLFDLKNSSYKFSGTKGQTVKLTLIANPIIPMSENTQEHRSVSVNSNGLDIMINSDDNISSIRVADLSGRVIKAITPDNTQMNITMPNRGIYMIEIITASSRSVHKVALN